MTKVTAGITTSVDGYITGPDDGPDKGLGEGGERLHWWVFGGPWTYDSHPEVEPVGEDKVALDEANDNVGAVVIGRGMYDAADAWGGTNPFPTPLFVVTHRVEDQPPADAGFVFVGDFDEAVRRATEAAGGKDVGIGGGADVIRQGLRAGIVEELTITLAPVILGAGKRLFDGFDRDVTLELAGPVRQSPFATHVKYRVVRD
ncbi:MAG: dihydrofolate reductase family protein [Candidatus Limnocylindria bacterium]